MTPSADPWWMASVLYQIYPRSYADSDNDGVGDLRGIIERLDHLQWLGIDGIWLSPITTSPNADWGYDVAGYCTVDPGLGTEDDFDLLVERASERHIRILLDLVPNHTSDRHPWFRSALTGPTSPHRNHYVWADPRNGGPPNNWVSSFGGPAWTLDERSGQYYLHHFLPEQPDLNWWNDAVRSEFDRILRFWFDRGVAGFRIDVCHMIVKDAELRDNPPSTDEDDWMTQLYGQRQVYDANRPEVHDVLRSWRSICDSYQPGRLLIGETNVEQLDLMASYYGRGSDELHLAFNFPFINASFEAEPLREIVERTEALLPAGAWPVWTGSNHDVSRLATRWAGGDPDRTRAALLVVLTLRGTPVLYQGDEIGLTDSLLEHEDLRDPVGLRFWPVYAGRDPVRTPMPWQDVPGGGFTGGEVTPWLPLEDTSRNVEDQRRSPSSVLRWVHDLIELRRERFDLNSGAYASLPAPPGTWAWRRGDTTCVAVNLTSSPATLRGVSGRVLLCTDRTRDGSPLPADRLVLAPWEAMVVDRG